MKFDKVSVWLKQGVKLDKFCKDEKIRVQPGVTTRYIKPAGRNDVTVTIVGLNFKIPMGTYHMIDGERVKVFYRGNKKTCARCHRFGEHCPGGGSAQDCEEAGGPKVSLASHMKELLGET